MSKKQSLGRGIDSLLPTDFSVEAVVDPGEQVKNIPIKDIVANPDQPRKNFDQEAIKELSKSIKQHGIIQPLVVTPAGKQFRIVAGERRYRAAKEAELKKLPVIVRDHKELEEVEIALVENVQRVDLSPLEQAASIAKLRDQFSLSVAQVATKLGKSEAAVSNTMRLLQLPPAAIHALQENKISEGHARAILALKTDEKLQNDLLSKIITQGWSVRHAELYVTQRKSQKSSAKVSSKLSAGTQKLYGNLPQKWQKKVSISEKNSDKGSIKISYDSTDELQNILKNLK